ncbi:hypothetical protein ASF00_10550 [Sphingomonas sp. Leaf34]|uniref:SGNH/GDSL hydrolase family protein n=1 Tax=Sphingomonas sp. Leaf34 TaxID=1736216 RepID=UPI0006F3D3CD|nr:SGNH/GDSL hydrolase family protein [Sphingomonas sp. Leaf34]KQN28302.1 hypothetical protein ASF00_10550 [Sphingomonas sp. Leaf34]
MTPTSARIDEDFTARFYRREPIVLELLLENADGAAEDLANRRFFAALYQPSGEVFDRVEATIATGTNGRPYLSCAFHGDITDALYGEQLLRYTIGEQLDSGQDVIVDGVLKILPAPVGASTGTSTIVDGIATRFVRRLDIAGRSRILVSERGPAGLSAAQIAVAANDITEPTPEAFMGHLRSTAATAARQEADSQFGDAMLDFGEFVGVRSAEIDGAISGADAAAVEAQAQGSFAKSSGEAAASVVTGAAAILSAVPIVQASQASTEQARDQVVGSVRNTPGTAGSSDPLVVLKNALGFVFGEIFRNGLTLEGVSINAPGGSGAFFSLCNELGFSPFGITQDGTIQLPGGDWRATELGGFELSSGGNIPLSYSDGKLGLLGASVRQIDDALFRIANPLGFVAFEIGIDGKVMFGPTEDVDIVVPPAPIDVTPVIGDELFLVSDRRLPIFGRNLLVSRSDDDLAVVSIESRKGAPSQPYLDSVSRGPLNLDPARTAATARLTVRKLGQRSTRLVKNLTAMVKTVPVVGSPAPKILLLGDSITNRATGFNIQLLLQSWGFAPVFIGTIVGSSSGSSSNTGGVLGEGREGWAFSDLFGSKLTDGDVPYGVLPIGQESTYATLTKTEKRGWQVFLNPNTATGAQTPIVTIGGVDYRFDLRFYLDRFSLANPDVVAINLAMNDKNEEGASQSLQQVTEGYGYLIDEIRRVLPSAQIVIWATMVPVDTNADVEWSNEWRPILASTINIVATRRAAGDTRLHLCSAWAHQSAEAGWDVAAGTLDPATGVATTTLSDTVHPGSIAREQANEALAAAIACIA